MPKKQLVSREDCIKIFTTYSEVGLSHELIKFEYGMCKMTVREELKTAEVKGSYYAVEFCEFLELICRVANTKFRNHESTLGIKVEQVLEPILGIIGAERIEVKADAGYWS